MDEIDYKALDLCFVGPGREDFDELLDEFSPLFADKNLKITTGEAFSAPEITTVLVNIGVGVISGLSTYVLSQLIHKLFLVKNEKKESSNPIQYNFTINFINSHRDIPEDEDTIIEILTELKKLKEK